ncbi:MAG: sodium:solute symporter family protein [Oscillospiraceae bacterium]|nr:sodium:solute symporter family protein [Oscillospiraceae bacterium]
MLSASAIWIAFACYMVFLIGVAVYVTQKEKKQASGGSLLTTTVPWFILVMTYIASLMSTWVFFAGPGAYYRGGLGYWLSEMSYIALFPFIAHFSMNKVWIINREYQGTFVTPADFYYERFKSGALRTILGIVFLIASFPYISSVIVAISQAASFITDGAISYKAAVIVVGLIMTTFVCFGGVKSAATADTVQGLVFICLLWVIAIFCLVYGLQGKGLFSTLWTESPEFYAYPGPSEWVPYSARFGYPFSCAIGWTIMLPHVFVRSGYFGDNLKAQRRLSRLTPALQALVWTGTMVIGAIGLALVKDLTNSDSELIIPWLVRNYIIGVNPGLGKFLLIGFFVGASAVGLSTSNAFLTIASAIVSSDILKHTFHVKVDEKKSVLFDRIIVAVLGVGSLLLALDPPELIFTLIMFAIAIVMPLFPILMFGLYWKKATKQAAILASIAGPIVVILCYLPNMKWNPIWGGGNWYGFWGLVVSTILMIVVSLVTKQDPKDSEEFYAKLESGMDRFYDRKKVKY